MVAPRRAPAVSAEPTAGQSPDIEFEELFGPGFPDPFEDIATLAVPPPSAVDIERAMTEGRRARRRRTAGVTSTVAAGLAACCVAALVTAGNGAARPETTDSALSITGTDPFVVGARFGWLPDGVEQTSSSLLQGSLWLSADNVHSIGRSAAPQIDISLNLFPAGSSEQSALDTIASDTGTATGIKAQITALAQPSINGRDAYLVTDPMPVAPSVRAVMLLWQMINGRWAELSEGVVTTTGGAPGIDATTLAAQTRHVAEAVTPDASGTALPLSITGLPSGSRITSYNLVRQNDLPTGWTTAIGVEVAGVELAYDEGPIGAVLPTTLGPTKCTTHNGLEACVTLASGLLSNGFPAGGLQALANDISLRSPAQSTWTTDVFPDY